MVYFIIKLDYRKCYIYRLSESRETLSIGEEAVNDWSSDPFPSLIKLDPHGIIQFVDFKVGEYPLPVDNTVHWKKLDNERRGDKNEQSSSSRTLNRLIVRDGTLDRNTAALLMTFLSDVVSVETNFRLNKLTILPEVNIGNLLIVKRIEFYRCTFEANSCFFQRPSSSEPRQSHDITGSSIRRELSLIFRSCDVPDVLDVSLLQDIPYISLHMSCMKGNMKTPLDILKNLHQQFVHVDVVLDIDSTDIMERCVMTYCTLLKNNTILIDIQWSFNISEDTVKMEEEQQQRLFDAAGKARSPFLRSLKLFCYPESAFRLAFLKKDILQYAHTWSRMRYYGLLLIGCSEENRVWMNNKSLSDRYLLGPVLYTPFESTSNVNSLLEDLNKDLVRKLIEEYLPIERR